MTDEAMELLREARLQGRLREMEGAFIELWNLIPSSTEVSLETQAVRATILDTALQAAPREGEKGG